MSGVRWGFRRPGSSIPSQSLFLASGLVWLGHAILVVQREKKDLNHVEKLITNPGTHTWPDILQSESAASPSKKHGISRGKVVRKTRICTPPIGQKLSDKTVEA